MNGLAIWAGVLAICLTAAADTIHFGDKVSLQGLEDKDFAWLTTNPYTDWVGNNKLPVGLVRSKITPHEKWIIESSDGPGTTGPVTHGSTVLFKSVQYGKYMGCGCSWCNLSDSKTGFYVWTVTGKGGDEVQSGQQVKLVNKPCDTLLQQAWYQWEYARGYWARSDAGMGKSNDQVQWRIYKD